VSRTSTQVERGKNLAYLPEIEHIPWTKVNDYLREIGGSKAREEFCERVLSGLARIIPSDMAGIFQFLGPCLHQVGSSERDLKAYESYYQFRLPWFPNSKKPAVPPDTIGKINWRTLSYRNSEFFTDFMFPTGFAKSLTATLPEVRLVTAMHRAPMALDFTDLENAVLNVVMPHVQNFYNCFDKITKLSRFCPTKEEIAEHFPILSNREAEVAALLCQGLTFSEAATCLFISRRTVERHVESLYDKLNVHDKKAAVEKLTRLK
jgi:DNA-binding CsgD family transcriptional regulator